MMRSFCVAAVLFFVFLVPMSALGQKKFKDSFRLIWAKSIGHSTEQKGSLNYNFPLRFSGDLPTLNKKYESSAYTYVYYVVKSEKANDKLFTLYHKGDLHSFYTDSIKSTTNRPIDLGFLEKGAMVNFNFYNKDFKKKEEGILYLENSGLSESELYEVLICSNCSDEKTKHQIQTYLAVKYGITLAQKDKYFASDNRKVWDEKLDKPYNNRIMGIARDDYFGLSQEAGYSNTEPSLILSKSSDQGLVLSTDLTYVLIGDNNGDKIFDPQSGLYKRRWLVQNRGDVDVKVDLRWQITPNTDFEYYLYNSQSTEIQNDLSDTLQLSFKNIEIKRDQYYYLSLEQKKPFQAKIYEENKGLNKKYILGVNEVGTGPFYITAKEALTAQEYHFVSETAQYNLEQLPTATYAFTVTDLDGNQAQLDGVFLDMSSTSLVSLASDWQLDGTKTLQIKPTTASGIRDKQLEYRWYFQDRLISEASSLHVNYPGSFSLEISDRKGKKEAFSFAVSRDKGKEKATISQWVVSPNPVNRGEEFTVTYAFDTPKKVDFYIYTLEGKFILRQQLGVVQNQSYTYTLQGATTYLIIPIINSKAAVQKLIVK